MTLYRTPTSVGKAHNLLKHPQRNFPLEHSDQTDQNNRIMKKIGIYEAKTQLSSLINELSDTGQGVALTKHGKVVAELHPPSTTLPARGCLKTANFHIGRNFDSDSLGFEDFFEDFEED